jgi:hypothetical protein
MIVCMPRPVVRVQRDSLGWAVDAPNGKHDGHLSKDEAMMRARQWVLGEERARIVVERESGGVERDIWFGRPSIPSTA